MQGDQRVGITWIADHHDADIAGGAVEGLALGHKDWAVVANEVIAFHAWAARFGPDKKRPIDTVKGRFCGIRNIDFAQRRKSAVFKFHGRAFGRLDGRRQFEQR